VLIVLKSKSLNLLEPSGPVQACNGIALPDHKHWGFDHLKVGGKKYVRSLRVDEMEI
jgi:hypothetical protein